MIRPSNTTRRAAQRTGIYALGLFFALGLAGTANASPAIASPATSGPSSTKPVPNDDADAAARVSDSEYVFVEGDTLEGETLSPGGTHISGPRSTNFESLISIRVTFTDQLSALTRDM